MSKAYFPKLDLSALASLRAIQKQLQFNPEYLDQKTCPYDSKTKQDLKSMLLPEVVEKVVEKIVEVERKVEIAQRAAEGGGVGPKKVTLKGSGVDLEGVSKEIQDIRTELQQLKTDSLGLETNDKIQIIKTRAMLVEKLVSMDEKVNNLKKVSLYQSTVMGILDDLMPEDRRKEFIKRIEPFAKTEQG